MSPQGTSCVLVLTYAVIAWALTSAGAIAAAADLNALQKQYNASLSAQKLPQAEAIARQGMAQAERGKNARSTITWLDNVAKVLQQQGHFSQAAPLFERALALEEKTSGPHHSNVAVCLNDLANLYVDQGKYAEAEPLFKRSLTIREKSWGKNSIQVATALNNFGNLCRAQARFAEAEDAYRQALTIRERLLGAKDVKVAQSLNNLGVLYNDQGKFADAEPLFRRSLAIYQGSLGPHNLFVADELNNLGLVCLQQGQHAEAETFCKQALAINERLFGEHPRVAMNLTNLASAALGQHRFDEAATYYRRALSINEQFLGPDHSRVARDTVNLAGLYQRLGDFERAAALYRRSLSTLEETYGADHYLVGQALYHQAALRHNQADFSAAETLIQRAIKILDGGGALPDVRVKSYVLKADLDWRAEREQEAIAAVNAAIDIAEIQRAQASGAERERALAFSQFAGAYQRLIDWQSQLGNTAAVFTAAERSRARSLVDQMAAAQVDLLAGLPEPEAKSLRTREADAQAKLAAFEKEWEVLQAQSGGAADATRVDASLTRARQEVVEAYVAIRNASPAYRQMVARDFRPVTIADAQTQLAGQDKCVLEYVIGEAESYVIVIGPVGTAPRSESLMVNLNQARALRISTGPLNASSLKEALMNEAGTGVLQMLRTAQGATKTHDALFALWSLLVPATERDLLDQGKVKQLIVIPDGQLATLPFETLVVEKGREPRYVLDLDIPIVYAPSATLLGNIEKGASNMKELRPDQGVLSVGDAIYGRTLPAMGAASRNTLTPLPSSGLESTWVVEAFQTIGVSTGQLLKADATEAQVRAGMSGRQVLHFACHGVTDQAFGNLFGGLVLSPGAVGVSNPLDDGIFTLAEIYHLNLKRCELAILSACNTNYGPQQQGEGFWALSRGFLVAGSRRVVASNWLVDDEAAAGLVYQFVIGVSRGQKAGAIDYALALHRAKRWVRDQEQWQSPYFWGPFVLVGPN